LLLTTHTQASQRHQFEILTGARRDKFGHLAKRRPNARCTSALFRCRNRLGLQNIGLTEQPGGNVRYTGHVSADVAAELSDVHPSLSKAEATRD
jgi:hypothetical protein